MPQSMAIAALHPTQLTIGLQEVKRRSDKIADHSPAKRADYLAKRVVPCIAGPGNQPYLIDHHHLCRALMAVGESNVWVEFRADASRLPPDEFWTYMDLQNWVHPFDAEGVRQPIASLPPQLADLVDDPYRALAGYLRREQGYTKADMPFEEFIWADFLRRRVPRSLVDADYGQAQKQALALAGSDMARHLPGWHTAA